MNFWKEESNLAKWSLKLADELARAYFRTPLMLRWKSNPFSTVRAPSRAFPHYRSSIVLSNINSWQFWRLRSETISRREEGATLNQGCNRRATPKSARGEPPAGLGHFRFAKFASQIFLRSRAATSSFVGHILDSSMLPPHFSFRSKIAPAKMSIIYVTEH